MDLIPLPQEVAEISQFTKIQLNRQIRLKVNENEKHKGDGILKKTYLLMEKYLNSHNFDLSKTNSLILEMHRAIITLQKRKRKHLQKKNRKW